MLTYRIVAVSSLILALNACGSDEEGTSTTTTSTATTETGTASTTTETAVTKTTVTETGLTETGTTTTTVTTTTTPPPLTLADGVQDIFNDECTDCHGGESPSADMDLSEGTAYSSIVGVLSDQSTLNIVTAGDASSSYVTYKLANTHRDPPADGSGVAMPKNSSSLSTADQALIVAWIDQGANQ